MKKSPKEDAIEAIEGLTSNCDNPREVEANLDILCTALIGLELVPLTKRLKQNPDLEDILDALVSKKLLHRRALTYLASIRELINVADYDIGDVDDFEADVQSEIYALQSELEDLPSKVAVNE